MQTSLLLMALYLSLPGGTQAFKPLISGGGSVTHRDITQRAVLRKTAEVCRALAAAQGQDFSLPIGDSLSVVKLQKACSVDSSSSTLVSTILFQSAIVKMYLSNALVDMEFALSKAHHFDGETFQGGRALITAGVSEVKASVKRGRFLLARLALGRVCHTLQDFYSHSNWVEMGNRQPYSTLIRPDLQLVNLAGPSTPTCRNCMGGNCTDNILPEVSQQGLLTSGYFNLFSSNKPAGKCSHGGLFDRTSGRDPVGGINKDDVGSSHGHLHHTAADVAVNATMELLEDIRGAAGDKDFLRLIGITQSSVLCFVIDTTGSMSDDITEAKRVSFSIIDSKRGTQQEPSSYILVPFNDPGFGPLITTTNADIFKQRINALTASGGGDIPELCLSGLQLALTAAPPSSEIFVFTDAPAKDTALKSTVTALIESTKSVVTFMLTDNLRSSRRRRSVGGASAIWPSQGGASNRMAQSDAQLYRDLAQASGGQAIEVTKEDLHRATSIIEDASAAAQVTVLQEVRSPGKAENFSFTVDESLRNLNAYITGGLLSFTLTSPSGVSQSNSEASGPLGTIQTVGNLHRVSLITHSNTGLWEISLNSLESYSLKVIGQSSVNFGYHFMEVFGGAHGDFGLREGRPLTGGNITLLVSVTGGDSVTVTAVALVEASGSGSEVNGTLQSLGGIGGGDFLVTVARVPQGEFVVRLRGESNSATTKSSPSLFQRQASTQIKTSSISVTAQADSTLEPGSTISVPFTVTMAKGTGGTFTIRATNDRGFISSFPASVSIVTGGGAANGTVTLTAPASTPSGTDVTLTIEAESAGATDLNYSILRLFVFSKVTDFTPPQCGVVSVLSNCLADCSASYWQLSANLTDGANGTGIDRVTLRQGNGTLNTSTEVGTGGENVTRVTYSATCCSKKVELVVVDRAGNVGVCLGSVNDSVGVVVSSTAQASVTNTTAVPVVSTTSPGGPPLTLSLYLRICVMLSLLWNRVEL
ncbi:von Willebrand factor A domain-containing protein 7 [Salmo salar]|uniref:von Willebrand factor A domain-containing protein 7 n=1 Tax=Salmo salar TaxID=8030 RepID=A0ABM3F6K4_SALSA|nr:von Willebrand factor A domain-containing protein 7 [Salmo salar]